MFRQSFKKRCNIIQKSFRSKSNLKGRKEDSTMTTADIFGRLLDKIDLLEKEVKNIAKVQEQEKDED